MPLTNFALTQNLLCSILNRNEYADWLIYMETHGLTSGTNEG